MEFLKKLNHWIYQVERAIVVGSLLVMSLVVFLSVAHRRYADPESVLATKFAKLLGADRETETWQSLQDIAGPITLVILAGVVYLGFRTASRRALWDRSNEGGKSTKELRGEPLSHAKCALFTVATLIGCWILMVLLFGTGKVEQFECIELRLAGEYSFDCGRFPAGLAWAQPLGLVLTLWVAFLGASMATKDNLHLKVEAVQKALPENLRRISGLISGLLTAGFCLLLAYLAYRFVVSSHAQWEGSDHLGGLHDGIEIPRFASFLIVPAAYMLMAARFVGLGVLAFRGELEETPAELRDLKAMHDEDKPPPDVGDGTKPSGDRTGETNDDDEEDAR